MSLWYSKVQALAKLICTHINLMYQSRFLLKIETIFDNIPGLGFWSSLNRLTKALNKLPKKSAMIVLDSVITL
jgi:hypothetical protein